MKQSLSRSTHRKYQYIHLPFLEDSPQADFALNHCDICQGNEHRSLYACSKYTSKVAVGGGEIATFHTNQKMTACHIHKQILAEVRGGKRLLHLSTPHLSITKVQIKYKTVASYPLPTVTASEHVSPPGNANNNASYLPLTYISKAPLSSRELCPFPS